MFLLINKPKDWTSFDVIAYLRQALKIKKIGHAGTLDPFATGLLIVGVGRESTKKLDEFKNLPKTYIATIKLGATSDTQDSTGVITISRGATRDPDFTSGPTKKDVKNTIKKFIGKQMQLPPMHSAKKINGKRLYKLARKGIDIEREPNEIEIYDIKLLDYVYPRLEISVNCGAGTYIRALAYDIGETLKTGAYCDELKRTKIGEYDIVDAMDVKDVNKSRDITRDPDCTSGENYLKLK